LLLFGCSARIDCACGIFLLPKEAINWDRIEGNWMQLKGKVKEQWGKLTDDQIEKIAGRRDQLLGKLEELYGITKDEAERQISQFETRCRDYETRETLHG